ncbi:enoyl-CoA hydratase/isomerase family protein [Catenulispora rubra]|uniref:enoyl-CoA hydratase/isomerase family protein n=1 Tax=Catenulispora rubra TaxID=280293 RepID=UPI0018922F2A|nr:enoyl-CoA hydratase/isomerase family protein [Catenulispora rubra]
MSEIKYAASGDVVVLSLDNPPTNLFDDGIVAGLRSGLHRAREEGARAVVIQAEGQLFSGGADIHLFADRSTVSAREMFEGAMKVIADIEDAPFPVIAAVHGLCLAAGLEIALASDLIIAAEGTEFAQVEARIGATTFLGGAYRLAERCGSARALEIVFGGEQYTAETFERWNIINRIVPAENLREEALAWAQRLAAGPTRAHAASKRMVQHSLAHGPREADRFVLDAATPLFESHDMQYAVKLLLEKGTRRFFAEYDNVVFEGK